MKYFKIIASLFLFTTIHLQINAQCAEIHFYRMNTLVQSDKVVLLYQDGVEIARVKKGQRYKAEVCSSDQFTFSVKTKSGEVSLSKQSISVEQGKKYYLKIACPFTPEVATINQKGESKGKKDLRRGSRFNGAEQRITLKVNSNPSINPSVDPAITPTLTSGKFKRSQVVGNFQFDVVNIVKAGDMLSMALKVTNLTSEDLVLYSAFYNIYFYDDLGNLLSANDLCIVNACENGQRTITKIQNKSYARTKSVIPYGIPMNMNINIRGIRNGSKKLTRGVFQMGFYSPNSVSQKTDFNLEYFDIKYPEVVDPNNSNRRIFGSNSLELISAKRKGKDVITRFRYKNGSNEVSKIALQNLSTYDDFGNKYTQREVSVFDGIQKRSHSYSRTHDVASNAEVDVEILFPDVVANTQNLKRLTLNLSGYTFEWNDIKIEGKSETREVNINSQPQIKRTNYIEYNDFETKVRSKESVIGKKIILEKIYFATGSDEILTNSHTQLNRLAQLMQANRNFKVEVSGHTDNVGDDIKNMVLSQKRADAIKYYLMGKSVTPTRISSVGKGSLQNIADNNLDSGRQQNRRVEIQIIE